MKIKIVNDSTDNQHYGHLIGKVFEVHHIVEEKKKYQIGHLRWMYFINFSDAEVLSEETRKDFEKKCDIGMMRTNCDRKNECTTCEHYKLV